MAAILADTTITDPVDKLILLTIANRADDNGGGARPDLAEMAVAGCCSTRTARRRTVRLETAGRFTRARQRRAGKLWRYEFALRGTPMMSPSADPLVATMMSPSADPLVATIDGPLLVATIDGPLSSGHHKDGRTVRPTCTSLGTSPPKPPGGGRERTEAKTRPRDDVWDATLAACDIDPDQLTASARGRLNRDVKELRDIGATPAEIQRRAGNWTGSYALTPHALVGNWPTLDKRALTEHERDREAISHRYSPEFQAAFGGAAPTIIDVPPATKLRIDP
jgi:hypothetical protein